MLSPVAGWAGRETEVSPLHRLRTATEYGIAYSHLRRVRIPAADARDLLKRVRNRYTRDHLTTALLTVGCLKFGNEQVGILTDDRDRILAELGALEVAA